MSHRNRILFSSGPSQGTEARTHAFRRRRRASALALTFAAGLVPSLAVLSPAGAAAAPDTVWGARTSLATLTSAERAANGPSYDNPALSRDGRYVAFVSDATNLVAGDTNRQPDVFVRDRKTGTTSRVSVSSAEKQANDQSVLPSMSADGRYVVFSSAATNLVAGDTNGKSDVFIRDLVRGLTWRLSVTSAERQVAGESFDGVISADGRSVVFVSDAPNLVAGDTNRDLDVFVRNRVTGTTSRVSVGAAGQANGRSMGRSISANGRYMAFVSVASNLVKGDTNKEWDVFLRDLVKGTTVRVSVSTDGRQTDAGDPMGTGFPQAISDDGRYVLFDHDATTLVDGDTNGRYDVFLRDVKTATTRRLSVTTYGEQLPHDSFARTMTGDAKTVLLSTYNEIAAGDKNYALDVFVLDRATNKMRLVSATPTGVPGNDDSGPAAISADGKHVAFLSHSSDLVRGDKNGESDMFVRDLR